MRTIGLAFGLIALLAAPVGAGATGHAAFAMVVFGITLFVANWAIRPETVRFSDRAALLAQVATAGALSALLVALGQTLRSLGGIESEVGLEGWLILAAWGIVLTRMVRRRLKRNESTQRPKTALRVVQGSGQTSGRAPKGAAEANLAPVPSVEDQPTSTSSDETPRPADPALAEALSRLEALDETDVSDTDLARTMETLSGAAPLPRVFAALSVRAPNSERDRRALVFHATDPWVAEQQIGKGEPAAAFEAVVAAADATALSDFATRCLALVDDIPDARADLPAIPRLLEIADQIEGDLETEAELLVALAHRLEDLGLEAEQTDDESG